jgi:dUTP pyrophosphatase
MQVKIKKLHPDAVIPKYAKEGDAGLDLVAISATINHSLHSGDQITYGTGLAMEIPEGFVGLIFPRSSVRNTGLSLSNCVGVIDSGYRGEIMATFNTSTREYRSPYNIGDRVMQIIIMPYPYINFVEAKELSSTERAAGGFGSSGK